MKVPAAAPDLGFANADSIGLDALATAANRCFTGYFVPVHLDAKTLGEMLCVDSVDLAASTVVHRAGEVIGVALVARRGKSCRLAAMAIEPNSRGKLVGQSLTEFILRTARERGDQRFSLEVIEHNVPGVRLYEAAGFQRMRRLVGYSATSVVSLDDGDLEETNPADVSHAVAQWGINDLPWQLSAATVAALTPPFHAFRLGPAGAVISNPESETITVRSLIIAPGARRQGWGTRLLQALSARFPGRKWRVPVWVPEEIPATFFTRLNFTREQLTQLQMARNL